MFCSVLIVLFVQEFNLMGYPESFFCLGMYFNVFQGSADEPFHAWNGVEFIETY